MEIRAKVMLSYDYCHFEMSLTKNIDDSEPEHVGLMAANELRKEVQRLCDEAVSQYKVSKTLDGLKMQSETERKCLEREVKNIKEVIPAAEWTPEQKSKIKLLSDSEYWARYDYNYEDGISPPF
jgi:hypothetical protein